MSNRIKNVADHETWAFNLKKWSAGWRSMSPCSGCDKVWGDIICSMINVYFQLDWAARTGSRLHFGRLCIIIISSLTCKLVENIVIDIHYGILLQTVWQWPRTVCILGLWRVTKLFISVQSLTGIWNFDFACTMPKLILLMWMYSMGLSKEVLFSSWKHWSLYLYNSNSIMFLYRIIYILSKMWHGNPYRGGKRVFPQNLKLPFCN